MFSSKYEARVEEEELESDIPLRNALRNLPDPHISNDFDAKVRRGVNERFDWRKSVRVEGRSFAVYGICSLAITLALLKSVVPSSNIMKPSLNRTARSAPSKRAPQRLDGINRLSGLPDSSLLGYASLK